MKIVIIESNTNTLEFTVSLAINGIETTIVMKEDSLFSTRKEIDYILKNKFVEGIIGDQEFKTASGLIYTSSKLDALRNADLVVFCYELAKEDFLSIFQKYSSSIRENVIVAIHSITNSIQSLVSQTNIPNKMIGIHIPILSRKNVCIEMIKVNITDLDVYEKLNGKLKEVGIDTIMLGDVPGLLSTRLISMVWGEALRIVEEQTADTITVDYSLKSLTGFKEGPFEMMDRIGLDNVKNAMMQLWKRLYYDAKYRPSLLVDHLIDCGSLGQSTQQGFFQYPRTFLPMVEDENLEALSQHIHNRVLCMFINEATDCVQKGIASEEEVDRACTLIFNMDKPIFTWLDEITIDHVIYTIDNLYDRYHDERYRVSTYLRDRTSLQ